MDELVDGQPVREAPVGVKRYEYHEKIPVRIRKDAAEGGAYQVMFGDLDLSLHLAANGVKVEFIEYDSIVPTEPTITLVFAPGATELDLDAELVSYLRAKDAAQQKPTITNHSREHYTHAEAHDCGGC